MFSLHTTIYKQIDFHFNPPAQKRYESVNPPAIKEIVCIDACRKLCKECTTSKQQENDSIGF